LVGEGQTSELAAAITRLLGDPALRTAMGRRGRERAVQEFSWQELAGEYGYLFGQVCESQLRQ
jgi:glycosyltransferase involved in cell wall biosynthesis